MLVRLFVTVASLSLIASLCSPVRAYSSTTMLTGDYTSMSPGSVSLISASAYGEISNLTNGWYIDGYDFENDDPTTGDREGDASFSESGALSGAGAFTYRDGTFTATTGTVYVHMKNASPKSSCSFSAILTSQGMIERVGDDFPAGNLGESTAKFDGGLNVETSGSVAPESQPPYWYNQSPSISANANFGALTVSAFDMVEFRFYAKVKMVNN